MTLSPMLASVVSRSEYLSVVIGLIVGLSLTRILVCISSSLPKKEGDRWSLTHSILLTAAFILQVKYWWDLYDAKVIEEVSFWGYLAILLVPLLMYLATAALTPEFHRDFREKVDYVEFFEQRRDVFYLFVMGVLVTIMAQGIFIWKDFEDPGAQIFYLIRASVILVIFILHRIRAAVVQIGLAFFLLIAMIAYTMVNQDGFQAPGLFR